MRQLLRQVDVGVLDGKVEQFGAGLSDPPPTLAPRDRASTGKAIRGSRALDVVVHLVGLARDGRRILAQTAVALASNESVAAAALLDGRDRRGTIITVNALLAQRSPARQIHEQSGADRPRIKENRPRTLAAIAPLVADPPHGEAVPRSRVQTVDTGHGRREWGTLETRSALRDDLDWPGDGQVVRRACCRLVRVTGELTAETHDGITDLPPTRADATCLEQVWRQHGSIENRVHDPRDLTLGEDKG